MLIFHGITNNGDEKLRVELVVASVLGEVNVKAEFYKAYIREVIESEQTTNALEEAIQETFNRYRDEEVDERHMMKTLVQCLDDFYEKDSNHFTRNNSARLNLNLQGYQKSDILRLILEKIVTALINQIDNKRDITNVEVYPGNIEALREQMITGLTHDVEGSIALSGMQATTAIGNRRSNQEDAVLLKTHPRNPKFKIMVVSDGMGGGDYGERASHTAIEEINKWFNTLPEEYYKNTKALDYNLREKLEEISKKIYMEISSRAGATIVGAIIGENDTLLVSVGDSRAYSVKGNKLTQITRDDSVVQNLYDEGEITQPDDMRFHKRSNQITQAIGSSGSNVTPNIYTVRNEEYDKLLLFSDGVTDCLSDEQILMITRRTAKERLAETIVGCALRNTSVARDGIYGKRDYVESIPGGKDNTTAAVYERE